MEVDISLRLKKSDHAITFLVALRFREYRSSGRPKLLQVTQEKPCLRKIRSRWRFFSFLGHLIGTFETAEPQRMLSRDQKFLTAD